MKKQYTREDKMKLCKKANENRNNGLNEFEGFALSDKIALVEWQVEVLNENSKLDHVRESYRRWEKMLIELRRQEVIEEFEVILTSKGKVKGVIVGANNEMLRIECKHCNSTGMNVTRNSNICNCCLGKGYLVINKPKELTKDKYIEALKKEALKVQKKRNIIMFKDGIENEKIEDIEKKIGWI